MSFSPGRRRSGTGTQRKKGFYLVIMTSTPEHSRRLKAELTKSGISHKVTKTSDSGGRCPLDPLWKKMPQHENRSEYFDVVEVRGSRGKLCSIVGCPDDSVKQGDTVHYPPRERRDLKSLCYVTTSPVPPLYPVYVISKGRWYSPLTHKALYRMGVPHLLMVEPSEYHLYLRNVPKEFLHKLPENFSRKGKGSIPVRNYVWDHAQRTGKRRHWILDDNINCFYRRNKNMKLEVLSGAYFRVMEEFVDRYDNVVLAGPHYDYFIPDQSRCYPPLNVNRRIYSCILIDTFKINHLRWRGKYNEDTDLALRALKEGHCSILFNAFLQKKVSTMKMKGGNTDSLYSKGRMNFVKSLVKQHPDVARHVNRYGRDHHHVDYSQFKVNELRERRGVRPPADPEWGMRLVKREASRNPSRLSPLSGRSPTKR